MNNFGGKADFAFKEGVRMNKAKSIAESKP